VKDWVSVYLGETGFLMPPTQYQIIAFLTSMENLALSLFVGEEGLSCCQEQW
jgi:hypothetical protein